MFDWCELGIQLQVPLYRLREIEAEKPTVRERRLEMLDCWLKGDNEHSKTFLKRALEKMAWNVKDSKPNEAGELIITLTIFFESLLLVCICWVSLLENSDVCVCGF